MRLWIVYIRRDLFWCTVLVLTWSFCARFWQNIKKELHHTFISWYFALFLMLFTDIDVALNQRYYVATIDVRKDKAEFEFSTTSFKLHFSDCRRMHAQWDFGWRRFSSCWSSSVSITIALWQSRVSWHHAAQCLRHCLFASNAQSSLHVDVLQIWFETLPFSIPSCNCIRNIIRWDHEHHTSQAKSCLIERLQQMNFDDNAR